ncbi:hydrolase TatD, partial [Candidatus Falkowbacteria bacterium CG_4_9_14_3_um_filter_36_9]
AKAKILQKNIFIKQLELSGALNLPVIIHCREAHNDLMAILKDFKKEYRHLLPKGRAWGVMHCYSGDEDMAWEYFSLGINISFTGLITFSKQWDDLIRKLPNDKFMIETDCPFMTPEPFRGQRNESRLVVNVAKRISEIKSIELKKIEEITTNNAKEFFRI